MLCYALFCFGDDASVVAVERQGSGSVLRREHANIYIDSLNTLNTFQQVSYSCESLSLGTVFFSVWRATVWVLTS